MTNYGGMYDAHLDVLPYTRKEPFYNLWTNVPLIISCLNDT